MSNNDFKYYKGLLSSLIKLANVTENKNNIHLDEDGLLLKWRFFKDELHSYNLTAIQKFSPNDYYRDEIKIVLEKIPIINKNNFSDRILKIDDDYFTSYKLFEKYTSQKAYIENPVLIDALNGNLKAPDAFIIYAKNKIKTVEELKEYYINYLEKIEDTLKRISLFFECDRTLHYKLNPDLIVKGLKLDYDSRQLKTIYSEFKDKLISPEHVFIKLLSGESTESKIMVSFTGYEMYDFMGLLFSDSPYTLKEGFAKFVDSSGNASKNAKGGTPKDHPINERIKSLKKKLKS